MAKLKIPKLRVSFLDAIQICRPKDPSSSVKSPLALVADHYFSPLSSHSFHISVPPTTPDNCSTRHSIGSSKIVPLGHGMTSGLDNDFSSHEYSKARKSDKERMYRSSFTNDRARPVASSTIEKKKDKAMTKKPKAKAGNENNPLKTIREEPLHGSSKSVKQRSFTRFKRFGSKDWKEGSITAPEEQSKPVPERLVPGMADKTVNQSFVVVKMSTDPYEDFKKSMLEMILEKQIFEPKELEQLLMSFLSLNSRLHHRAILKAFTEIWKEVFSGTSN